MHILKHSFNNNQYETSAKYKRKLCSYALNKRSDIEGIKTLSQIKGSVFTDVLPGAQFPIYTTESVITMTRLVKDVSG